MKTLSLPWFILSALVLNLAGTAFAQGPAFTYHGRLNDSGGPANGSYDLTFSVFEVDAAGSPVGSTLTNTSVGVTNGLFTALLDFGPGIFTGPDRWLELGVRTNGVGDFTPLSPRQRLTPTPYAIMANTASNLLGPLPVGQLLGTLADAQIPANVPRLDGNATFTGVVNLANQANSVAGNGSGLTDLNASHLNSGTVADARLSLNVSQLDAHQTFSGSNYFSGVVQLTNPYNTTVGQFIGNGAALSNLVVQAANLQGSLVDTQLSANVALLNTPQTFSGSNTFSGVLDATNGDNTFNGNFAGNGSSLVELNPTNLTPGTAAIDISGHAASATSATTAANALAANTAITANSFSSPLVGDVAGPQGATVVVSVGGQTAIEIASSALAAKAATDANTPDTIVRRDSAGNFAVGAITASSVGGDGSALTALNASGLASGTINDARLSGNVALLGADQTFSKSNIINGVLSATNTDNTIVGTFTGDGSGLTNLVGGVSNVVLGAYASIPGGIGNSAIGKGGFVGGGSDNSLSTSWSAIGGGKGNRISSGAGYEGYETIAGGTSNQIGDASESVIGGGSENVVGSAGGLAKGRSTIAGGYDNKIDLSYGAAIGGGTDNKIVGTGLVPIGSTIAGGWGNRITATGGGSTIAGGQNNSVAASSPFTSGGTVGGGSGNSVDGEFDTVAGGLNNSIIGRTSGATIAGGAANSIVRGLGELRITGEAIGGGWNNLVLGDFSTISGGSDNLATNNYATISGGKSNTATNEYATIGGGHTNTSSGYSATVGGGESNMAAGRFAFVGGGTGNYAGEGIGSGGEWATIGGGSGNTASFEGATVGGGIGNTASYLNATVGGGQGNVSKEQGAVVAGGIDNIADGDFGTVGGGMNNRTSGHHGSTVGGGSFNLAIGTATTVGGGEGNTVSGFYSTVSGGYQNTGSGFSVTVGGGEGNVVTGSYSAIPGGLSNSVSADYAFAAGYRANATNTGAFVWSDNSDFDFFSTATNEFSVRSTGGARFVSAIAADGIPTAGVELVAGGGSWSSLSDRSAKENFAAINPREILERVNRMPITTWNYKSQDAAIRHIGPMAQDFAAAFQVGENDRRITTVDADGVALAAIQGLNQKLEEKESEIQSLHKRLEVLERAILGRKMAQSGGEQ